MSSNILSFLGNLTILFFLLIFLLTNFITIDYWIFVGYLFYYTIILYALFLILVVEIFIVKKIPQKYLFKKYTIELSKYKILFYIGITFSIIYFVCVNVYLLFRLIFKILIQ